MSDACSFPFRRTVWNARGFKKFHKKWYQLQRKIEKTIRSKDASATSCSQQEQPRTSDARAHASVPLRMRNFQI